ncbi:MAG: 2-isopropylmalate synthase [Nanoarchaeota archaeon]|nr:2-isopropylmalate synthase [Nanoarchaeota archaeon]
MVQILDTTLREGEQTPGVYFDSHIKLAIARLLDSIGIDIIEAGHPTVSSEIDLAVRQIANSNLRALTAAHSRTLKKDVDAAIMCNAQFLGLFYCVSEERLNGIFKKTIADSIKQIAEVIEYAKKKNPDLIIRYTPEDTVRSEFENVLKASVAAVKAGADIISIADTTGYMVPGTERSMYKYVKRLKAALGEADCFPKIAVHCHNDRGLALANALDGYRAGADIIDATVLNIGERAGIVDLAQLLTVLTLDFKENNWDLSKLDELYKLVSFHSKIDVPINFPIMGRNSFTHCAGLHTQAAVENPEHYQSIDPAIFNRKTGICLDHMSGKFSIQYMLKKLGEDPKDENLISMALEKVKQVGTKGKYVDLDEFRHIVEWCKS